MEIDDLKRGHAALADSCFGIQGTIRVYRVDIVNMAALDSAGVPAGTPMIYSGTFWRSRDRFRADFEAHLPEKSKSAKQSVAVEGDTYYELSQGLGPDDGMLRVYHAGTAEAATPRAFIASYFYDPICSLWSSGGIPVLDMLQRPTSTIEASADNLDTMLLRASSPDGTVGEFTMGAEFPYPLLRASSSVGEGGTQISVQRRVLRGVGESERHPARLTDVASIGGTAGYTQLFELAISPLQSKSPIDRPITPASFRDVGFGYQVYDIGAGESETLKERYASPRQPQARMVGGSRRVLLWLNGIVLALLAAGILYRVTRRRT